MLMTSIGSQVFEMRTRFRLGGDAALIARRYSIWESCSSTTQRTSVGCCSSTMRKPLHKLMPYLLQSNRMAAVASLPARGFCMHMSVLRQTILDLSGPLCKTGSQLRFLQFV